MELGNRPVRTNSGLYYAPDRREPKVLGHHVAREPERRVNDGIGVPAGGEAVVEAPDDVRTQEPAKSSGVIERIAPGFDQSLHEPVRVRPGDRME